MKTNLYGRGISACLLLLLLLACSGKVAPVNVDANGNGIKGYDPVAYFTDGQPVQGKMEFQLEWRGAKWLFASREHLEMFRNAPEKYAPQYGGY